MIQSVEQSRQQQTEKPSISEYIDNPSLLYTEIQKQESHFWSEVNSYNSLLTAENLATEAPRIAREVVEEAKGGDSELVYQAKFFALVSVAEHIRTGYHQPTWEQALAALHILNNPLEGQVQRILMGTGEGKTFTIAMAALWRARNGQMVHIHTDKQANVEQSYNKTKPLYKLFNTRLGKMEGAYTASAIYRQVDVVRYGTWSQFHHEYLRRKLALAKARAVLRGDHADQRDGDVQLSAFQRKLTEATISLQEKLLRPHTLINDEGDKSFDLETSEVVITEPSNDMVSPAEEAELYLAWELFSHPPEGEDFHRRVADALQTTPQDVKRRYEIRPAKIVEGTQEDDQTYIVTSQGVQVGLEQFFYAQVVDTMTSPGQLLAMIELGQLHFKEAKGRRKDPVNQRSFNSEDLSRLAKLAKSSQAEGAFDWSEVRETLPPFTRGDLRTLFGKNNPLYSFSSSKYITPEVKKILADKNPTITSEEWQILEKVLPNIEQLLTVVKLFGMVQEIWGDTFNSCYKEALDVLNLYKEGDHYRIEEVEVPAPTPDEPERTVRQTVVQLLNQDREPEPNKQHHYMAQVFLHIKHGLPLPTPDRTIARILPATYHTLMAEQGVGDTSISGTQDDPDFIVPVTGESDVNILPHRVFANRETKLSAISYYVGQNRDKPILLCAQKAADFQQLQEDLTEEIGAENLIIIDAGHAEDSFELVPQLEAGKVVLLQLSARGLDFGRLLDTSPESDGLKERPRHSFEDGIVISASELTNPHQQQQLEGRLGNRRPNGQVVTFTALDDEVAEQRYKTDPELIQKRRKTVQRLENEYREALEKVFFVEDIIEFPTFTQLMAALQAYEEGKEEGKMVTEDDPLWLRFVLNHSSVPSEFAASAADFQLTLSALSEEFDAFSHGHVETVERQQTANMVKLREQRREQILIDRVVQDVWGMVLDPPQEIQEVYQEDVDHLNDIYRKLLHTTLIEYDFPAPYFPENVEAAAAAVAAHQQEGMRLTGDDPLWLRLVFNDYQLHPQYRKLAREISTLLPDLIDEFEALRLKHLKELEQNELWKAVEPLTFEQRQDLMARVFEESHFIYYEVIREVKKDPLGSDASLAREKYARFFVGLTDRIIDWVNFERWGDQYNQLREGIVELQPFDTLPEDLEDLQEWLKQHSPKRNIFRSIFTGVRQMSAVDMVTGEVVSPEPPLPEPDDERREKVMIALKILAKDYEETARKYRTQI